MNPTIFGSLYEIFWIPAPLFLQLGLILVLFITWQAIEWKTYDREAIDTGQLNLDDLDDEEIPITEIQNQPPPPPPPPPVVIILQNHRFKHAYIKPFGKVKTQIMVCHVFGAVGTFSRDLFPYIPQRHPGIGIFELQETRVDL